MLQLHDQQITEIIEFLDGLKKGEQYEIKDNSELMAGAALNQAQLDQTENPPRLFLMKRLIEIKKKINQLDFN